MRKLAILFVLACPIFAQPVSFGLIGGANLTQDFQNRTDYPPCCPVVGDPATFYSTPKRWMAGATIEVRLPIHLSVEADAVYHELEFTSAGIEPNGTLNSISPSPVVTWEFPLLLKYRFSLPIAKPFLNGGPAFRTTGNLNGTNPSHYGLAAGLGAEVPLWRLKVSPQFRYLRWARDQLPPFLAAFSPYTIQDQIEFLTAITF